MTKAAFVAYGDSFDYTTDTEIEAGDVIVVGSRALVAPDIILAGKTGSLRTRGLYSVQKVSGVAFTKDDAVYWFPTGNPVSGTAGSGCATDDDTKVFLGEAGADAASGAKRVMVYVGVVPPTQGDKGDQGDPGLSLTVRGDWADTTPYAVNDVVRGTDGAYVCTTAHTSGSSTHPSTGGSYAAKWLLLAADGAAGADGSDGSDGSDGAAGDTGPSGSGFNWRGDWADVTAYDVADVVRGTDGTYICISAHTSGSTTHPSTGGSYTTKWNLVALDGS